MTTKGFILRGGYRYIHKPDHPRSGKQGYIAEHRLVMEAHLGRYLERGEVVHHIDSDIQNNAVENLQVFPSPGQHTKHAHPEAIQKGAQVTRGVRPPNYNRGTRHCLVCQSPFETTLGPSGKKFCRIECFWESRRGKPQKNMKGLKLGRGWNKGKPLTWAPRGKDSPHFKHGKFSKFV